MVAILAIVGLEVVGGPLEVGLGQGEDRVLYLVGVAGVVFAIYITAIIFTIAKA